MAILLLSCSDDQPSAPVNSNAPVQLFMVTYGREMATAEDQAIHFEPYHAQDIINFASLGETENVALRIYENHLMAYVSPPPKASFRLSLTTRRDREDLQGGATLFIRGMGWGTLDTVWFFQFTSIIPARLATQVTPGDDTLEFIGGEDDFLTVSYDSPFSHKSISDTLIIKKIN